MREQQPAQCISQNDKVVVARAKIGSGQATHSRRLAQSSTVKAECLTPKQKLHVLCLLLIWTRSKPSTCHIYQITRGTRAASALVSQTVRTAKAECIGAAEYLWLLLLSYCSSAIALQLLLCCFVPLCLAVLDIKLCCIVLC